MSATSDDETMTLPFPKFYIDFLYLSRPFTFPYFLFGTELSVLSMSRAGYVSNLPHLNFRMISFT